MSMVVIAALTVPLDGFVARPNDGPDNRSGTAARACSTGGQRAPSASAPTIGSAHRRAAVPWSGDRVAESDGVTHRCYRVVGSVDDPTGSFVRKRRTTVGQLDDERLRV